MDMDIPLNQGGPFVPVPVPVMAASSAPAEQPAAAAAQQPSFLASALSRPPRPSSISASQRSALVEQGFTEGLAEALHASANAFPLRIWVVDNSGSMRATDGNRFVQTSKKDDIKVVDCTRWRKNSGGGGLSRFHGGVAQGSRGVSTAE